MRATPSSPIRTSPRFNGTYFGCSMIWPNSHFTAAKLRLLSSGSPSVVSWQSWQSGTTLVGSHSLDGAACLETMWCPSVAGCKQRTPFSSIETQSGLRAIRVLINLRQGALSSALSIGEDFFGQRTCGSCPFALSHLQGACWQVRQAVGGCLNLSIDAGFVREAADLFGNSERKGFLERERRWLFYGFDRIAVWRQFGGDVGFVELGFALIAECGHCASAMPEQEIWLSFPALYVLADRDFDFHVSPLAELSARRCWNGKGPASACYARQPKNHLHCASPRALIASS